MRREVTFERDFLAVLHRPVVIFLEFGPAGFRKCVPDVCADQIRSVSGYFLAGATIEVAESPLAIQDEYTIAGALEKIANRGGEKAFLGQFRPSGLLMHNNSPNVSLIG